MTEALKKAAQQLEELDETTGGTNTIDVYLRGKGVELSHLADKPGRFRLIKRGGFFLDTITGWEDVDLDKLAGTEVATVGENFKFS